MSKYDWSRIEPEIKFIATDFSRFKHGYTEKPELKEHLDFWDGDGCFHLGFSEFQGDWQDSLEERPK